jgi:hypothetical protein|tara:strand:+ start:1458 stop:1670 length:213 start_codon:yes stop_codon:yes gene_type:complete
MKPGDLVIITNSVGTNMTYLEERVGLVGIITLDHSPMRPPEVGRVVDVMWDNGTIEDMYSDDLEVVSETR